MSAPELTSSGGKLPPYSAIFAGAHSQQLVADIVARRPWWKPALALGSSSEAVAEKTRTGEWHLLWTDASELAMAGNTARLPVSSLLAQAASVARPGTARYQLVNQLPGAEYFTHGACLLRAAARAVTGMPSVEHLFDLVPMTWGLPTGSDVQTMPVWQSLCRRVEAAAKPGADPAASLRMHRSHSKQGLWLVKPATPGAATTTLAKGLGEVARILAAGPVGGRVLVQKLLEAPLTFRGHKVSMRAWLLVQDTGDVWVHTAPYWRVAPVALATATREASSVQLWAAHSTGKSSTSGGNVEAVPGLPPGRIMLCDEFPAASVVYGKVMPWLYATATALVSANLPELRGVDAGPTKRRAFQMFELDVTVDVDMKPWLTGIRARPTLDTYSAGQERLVQGALEQAFRIAVDPLFPSPDVTAAARKCVAAGESTGRPEPARATPWAAAQAALNAPPSGPAALAAVLEHAALAAGPGATVPSLSGGKDAAQLWTRVKRGDALDEEPLPPAAREEALALAKVLAVHGDDGVWGHMPPAACRPPPVEVREPVQANAGPLCRARAIVPWYGHWPVRQASPAPSAPASPASAGPAPSPPGQPSAPRSRSPSPPSRSSPPAPPVPSTPHTAVLGGSAGMRAAAPPPPAPTQGPPPDFALAAPGGPATSLSLAQQEALAVPAQGPVQGTLAPSLSGSSSERALQLLGRLEQARSQGKASHLNESTLDNLRRAVHMLVASQAVSAARQALSQDAAGIAAGVSASPQRRQLPSSQPGAPQYDTKVRQANSRTPRGRRAPGAPRTPRTPSSASLQLELQARQQSKPGRGRQTDGPKPSGRDASRGKEARGRPASSLGGRSGGAAPRASPVSASRGRRPLPTSRNAPASSRGVPPMEPTDSLTALQMLAAQGRGSDRSASPPQRAHHHGSYVPQAVSSASNGSVDLQTGAQEESKQPHSQHLSPKRPAASAPSTDATALVVSAAMDNADSDLIVREQALAERESALEEAERLLHQRVLQLEQQAAALAQEPEQEDSEGAAMSPALNAQGPGSRASRVATPEQGTASQGRASAGSARSSAQREAAVSESRTISPSEPASSARKRHSPAGPSSGRRFSAPPAGHLNFGEAAVGKPLAITPIPAASQPDHAAPANGAALSLPASADGGLQVWVEVQHRDGEHDSYFYHALSRATRWDRPAGAGVVVVSQAELLLAARMASSSPGGGTTSPQPAGLGSMDVAGMPALPQAYPVAQSSPPRDPNGLHAGRAAGLGREEAPSALVAVSPPRAAGPAGYTPAAAPSPWGAHARAAPGSPFAQSGGSAPEVWSVTPAPQPWSAPPLSPWGLSASGAGHAQTTRVQAESVITWSTALPTQAPARQSPRSPESPPNHGAVQPAPSVWKLSVADAVSW